MKVDIILITYNQEKYIKQAIESILIQQFPCDVEIIVADDNSTDNTLNIIQSYQNNTTVKFKFLAKEKRLGHPHNYKRAIAACDGDYVAILEGDDYWTSTKRIEEHVRFLEEHRECVLSMNRLILYYESSGLFEIQQWDNSDNYKYITTPQMIYSNCLGNLSGCVIRKSELDKLDSSIFDLDIDDWLLGIALSQYGLLAILKSPMSVYRKHNSGQWSGRTCKENLERMLERVEKYNVYFNYKYDEHFKRLKQNLLLNLFPVKKSVSIKYYVPPIIILLIKLFIPKAFYKRRK